MFDVLLHPMAAAFLERVETETCRQIKKKLNELREFPERGKHLRYTRFWSLRIGDYRAIYEIKAGEQKVIVLFIGHRDDVYDNFDRLW